MKNNELKLFSFPHFFSFLSANLLCLNFLYIFDCFLVTPPAQRVQFILGEEGRQEPALETHPVFSEMEELFVGEDGDMEWKETARLVQGTKMVLSLKAVYCYCYKK